MAVPPSMQTSVQSKQRNEQLHAANVQLARETPERIIEWAGKTYGASICFATMLDIEGCALVRILAATVPSMRVLMPDTGYLSPQVLSLREHLQQRYQLPIHLIRPSSLTASFESDFGPLFTTHTSRCCRVNRWEPMRKEFDQYTARIAARRRGLCPAMQPLGPVAWDETLQLVQINPLTNWSDDDLRQFLLDQQIPHLSADAEESILGCAMCSKKWYDVVPGDSDVPASNDRCKQKLSAG